METSDLFSDRNRFIAALQFAKEHSGKPFDPAEIISLSDTGIPFNIIAQQVVRHARRDLDFLFRQLMNAGEAQRKQALKGHLQRTRQQVLRLIALLQWLQHPHASLTETCSQQKHQVVSTSQKISTVADELFSIHTALQAMLVPDYDTATATDIFTSGRYLRLPRCLDAYVSDPTLQVVSLSPEEIESNQEALNAIIHIQLLETELPSIACEMRVERGRLWWEIPHLATIELILGYQTGEFHWVVLDVTLHVALEPDTPIHPWSVRRQYTEILQNAMTNSETPLVACYNQLQKVCQMLAYQLLKRKLLTMAQASWRFFSLTQSSTTQCEVVYWRDAPCLKELTRSIDPSIALDEIFVQFVKSHDWEGSAVNTLGVHLDETLILKHTPPLYDFETHAVASFDPQLSNLQFDRVLARVVRIQSRYRLELVAMVLHDLFRTQSFVGEDVSVSIDSSNGAPQLLIRLWNHATLVISICARTGRFRFNHTVTLSLSATSLKEVIGAIKSWHIHIMKAMIHDQLDCFFSTISETLDNVQWDSALHSTFQGLTSGLNSLTNAIRTQRALFIPLPDPHIHLLMMIEPTEVIWGILVLSSTPIRFPQSFLVWKRHALIQFKSALDGIVTILGAAPRDALAQLLVHGLPETSVLDISSRWLIDAAALSEVQLHPLGLRNTSWHGFEIQSDASMRLLFDTDTYALALVAKPDSSHTWSTPIATKAAKSDMKALSKGVGALTHCFLRQENLHVYVSKTGEVVLYSPSIRNEAPYSAVVRQWVHVWEGYQAMIGLWPLCQQLNPSELELASKYKKRGISFCSNPMALELKSKSFHTTFTWHQGQFAIVFQPDYLLSIFASHHLQHLPVQCMPDALCVLYDQWTCIQTIQKHVNKSEGIWQASPITAHSLRLVCYNRYFLDIMCAPIVSSHHSIEEEVIYLTFSSFEANSNEPNALCAIPYWTTFMHVLASYHSAPIQLRFPSPDFHPDTQGHVKRGSSEICDETTCMCPLSLFDLFWSTLQKFIHAAHPFVLLKQFALSLPGTLPPHVFDPIKPSQVPKRDDTLDGFLLSNRTHTLYLSLSFKALKISAQLTDSKNSDAEIDDYLESSWPECTKLEPLACMSFGHCLLAVWALHPLIRFEIMSLLAMTHERPQGGTVQWLPLTYTNVPNMYANSYFALLENHTYFARVLFEIQVTSESNVSPFPKRSQHSCS